MFSFNNMKILINILLVVIFVYYFGMESFKRYRNKAVFIHQYDYIPSERSIPGYTSLDSTWQIFKSLVITVIPKTPGGSGMKDIKENFTLQTGSKLQELMEKSGYTIGEVLMSSSAPVATRTIFSTEETWLVHSISPPPNSLTSSVNTTLKLSLNPRLEYFIMITDKTFTLLSANPQVVPKALLKAKRNAGKIRIYLAVIINNSSCLSAFKWQIRLFTMRSWTGQPAAVRRTWTTTTRPALRGR